MKKILNLFILAVLVLSINVYADTCKQEELSNLNKVANNIKVNYEIIANKVTVPKLDEDFETELEGEFAEITSEKIKISVYNLDKDIYIIQTDDKSSEKKVINYVDTDNGTYSFETNDIYDYTKYQFAVYSNITTCDATLIKTINYTKPKLNINSEYQVCIENPTVPACQRYITQDTGVSEAQIVDYVNKYISNQEKTTAVSATESKRNTENNNNYIVYCIIGGGIVIVGITAYIVYNKKRSAL